MRGIVVLFVGATVLMSAACAPRPSPSFDPGPCDVRSEGASQLEQAYEPIVRIPGLVRYFVSVDDGGPLTCRPGTGSCDECRGAAVDLPIGEQSTLVVEAQTENTIEVNIDAVSLTASTGGSFVVLEPVPTTTSAGFAAPIFIGVTPASTDVAEVGVIVATDAGNDFNGDDADVFLRVRGVEP